MVIPARSVLATWRTRELETLGGKFRTDGYAIRDASDKVDQEIASLKRRSAWGGDSQPAARDAAHRVGFMAHCLGNIGTSISVKFRVYGSIVAAENIRINRLVELIENVSLYVTDNWQVLVRVEKMTPDMARLMALAAQGFQDQLNSHLRALGNADNEFAVSVRRKTNSSWLDINLSEEMDQPGSPVNATGAPYDADERAKQQKTLEQHMFGTVVDKKVSHEGDEVITELQMLDGSRQVYTAADDGKTPLSFDLYDTTGTHVSHSDKKADGTVITTLFQPGGRPIFVTKRPGQDAVADVDGKKLRVPNLNTIMTATDSVVKSDTPELDQLATHARNGKMPFLSAETSGKLAVGADMASSTLSVLSTLYFVASESDYYKSCEAGVVGSGSAIGASLATMIGRGFGGTFLRSVGGGVLGWAAGWTLAPYLCEK